MSVDGDNKRENLDDRILEEAGVWFMRLEAGETSEDAPDYRAWLEASEDHQDAMIRARITWGVLGDNARSPEITAARRDALTRLTRLGERRWKAFSKFGATIGWRARAAAAAILLALIAAPIMLVQFGGGSSGVAAAIYATDVAETRIVTLADNSRISLDAATRVEVDYSATARDITLLQGQAHFEVAKDTSRPFRVTAGGQTVVATGTAFNVEMIGKEVLVTLLEGEVIVTDANEASRALISAPVSNVGDVPEDAAKAVKLKPGEQLLAAANKTSRVERAPNLEKTSAWRQGKVFLEDDPLSVAVERMNRYSRIRLSIADDRLDALEVGGVFNAGDTDAFIEALEATFPVEARRMSSSSIELHPRS